MNIDKGNFFNQKPKIEDDFDLDEEKERRRREEAEKEGRKVNSQQIEAERLSRPQNIMVSKRQVDKIKEWGEVELTEINFRGRVINPGEKVILVGENEKIEAEFVEVVKENFNNGNLTIRVRLIKKEN